MISRLKKYSIAALTLLASSFFAPTVLAQAGMDKLKDVAGAAGVPGSASDASLASIVGVLIKQVLSMVGIILVILVIYGGLMWMMAGGNDEKVSKAKKVLSNATIGIIIIFGAYAITAFVLEKVLLATG